MNNIDVTIDGIRDALLADSKGHENEAAIAVAGLELLRGFLKDVRRIAVAAEVLASPEQKS